MEVEGLAGAEAAAKRSTENGDLRQQGNETNEHLRFGQKILRMPYLDVGNPGPR